MIKEAMEHLGDEMRAKHRDAVLELEDGSERRYLYNDKAGGYEQIERYHKRERKVSNVESFAALVLEEARRAGVDQPDDGPIARSQGDRMTVIFGTRGALVHLDDRDGRTVFDYQRELSPQWALLAANSGKALEHADFIRLLQGLRPSIPDYTAVMMQFRKVSVSQGLSISSAPIFEEGKAGASYSVEFVGQSGNTKAALPGNIEMTLPFARGSKKTYSTLIEVSADLAEKKDKKILVFSLIFAEQSVLSEQAIADEVAAFREAVKPLPKLLILESY